MTKDKPKQQGLGVVGKLHQATSVQEVFEISQEYGMNLDLKTAEELVRLNMMHTAIL